jgi:AdoMet-dependent rRNA methyltransferase SPB1
MHSTDMHSMIPKVFQTGNVESFSISRVYSNKMSRFVQEESKHCKPSLPVSKEAVAIMKQKMRALDARPIKKVAEAKFRKQMRAERRLAKASQRAEGLQGQEDMSEKSKMEAIAKMMKKARNKPNQREKPKVVVAKGSNRGNRGRPKGVKGRYKVILYMLNGHGTK